MLICRLIGHNFDFQPTGPEGREFYAICRRCLHVRGIDPAWVDDQRAFKELGWRPIQGPPSPPPRPPKPTPSEVYLPGHGTWEEGVDLWHITVLRNYRQPTVSVEPLCGNQRSGEALLLTEDDGLFLRRPAFGPICADCLTAYKSGEPKSGVGLLQPVHHLRRSVYPADPLCGQAVDGDTVSPYAVGMKAPHGALNAADERGSKPLCPRCVALGVVVDAVKGG